ncbi:DUF1801 domain-containing protein [Parvularcula sp. ZS-1/3]|uniref:DUF1801 domain-containing protein n=1 Tax=Parvularcula mediterranea TaxID=2732508 RepID=A0A7Y3W5H9_9PROT|nr:DUF1801 domain-containing protein [Parvularcula mediterranea]NNU16296.1 DUF1801 domain-containing protein [Parvularcula mediterranea]
MATVQEYFDKQEGEVQSIALALRAVLDEMIPDAEVKLAWGFPCWLRGKYRVASIIAHTDRCNLQLWQGSALADQFPERIEGTGKDLRHVKVRKIGEVDEGLRAIMDAALALDPKAIR